MSTIDGTVERRFQAWARPTRDRSACLSGGRADRHGAPAVPRSSRSKSSLPSCPSTCNCRVFSSASGSEAFKGFFPAGLDPCARRFHPLTTRALNEDLPIRNLPDSEAHTCACCAGGSGWTGPRTARLAEQAGAPHRCVPTRRLGRCSHQASAATAGRSAGPAAGHRQPQRSERKSGRRGDDCRRLGWPHVPRCADGGRVDQSLHLPEDELRPGQIARPRRAARQQPAVSGDAIHPRAQQSEGVRELRKGQPGKAGLRFRRVGQHAARGR